MCWFTPINNIVDFYFYQAEDGIRDRDVTGVQTCALPIFKGVEEIIHYFYDKGITLVLASSSAMVNIDRDRKSVV